MLTDKTLTIEVSGVMGSGFLPGLLQLIQDRLRSRFSRLQPDGKRRPLAVRFRIDNTAALKDPVERDRIAHLINHQPRPGSREWDELVDALKQADRRFERSLDQSPLPVDLAFRRGGLIQSYILLNSKEEWLKVALDRPRVPNLVVYLTADLATTAHAFEHDADLRATLANDPQAYCATPQRAMEQQQRWTEAMRQIPGVIMMTRTTPDKNVLADEIIARLRSSLETFGCPLIEQTKVFISYATADEAFAARLHADLQAAGIPCWFAPHDIRGGRKLHEQIDEAISSHDRMLLILSEASLHSEWVKTEIAKARRRESRERRRVLFPIRLLAFDHIRDWECFDADTGKDSAREIREYFIPDFTNWTDPQSYRQAFRQLIGDIMTVEPPGAETLSRGEFDELKSQAIDPVPLGPIVRANMNRDLSDEVLRSRLRQRIAARQPVYLLLSEYERRLQERGIKR
jgi:hypothetical protein